MVLSKKQKEWWISGFSADAQDAFDLMDNDPPPTLKFFMAQLIDSQVESGNWDLFDFIQMQRIDTAGNSVINWIGNYSNGLFVNGPTFATMDGVTGDGVTESINNQYNPNVDSTVGVGQNNLQVGVYCLENFDVGNLNFLFGLVGVVFLRLGQGIAPELLHNMNDATLNSSGASLLLDDRLYTLRRTEAAGYDVLVDKSLTAIVEASTGLISGDISTLARTAGQNLNAKAGCSYACNPVGFNHDNWVDNLKIYMTNVATLQ